MLGRGDLAPDFTLPRLVSGHSSLGEFVELGPVLLFFFKQECGASDVAAPLMQRIADSFSDHQSAEGTRLTVVGVSQDAQDATRRFCAVHGLRIDTLLDSELAVSRAFDLEVTPTMVLLRGAERLRADSAKVDSGEGRRIADLIEGWSRSALELMAEEIAARVGTIPPELFVGQEVPESRPG